MYPNKYLSIFTFSSRGHDEFSAARDASERGVQLPGPAELPFFSVI
jgi:hypothetical protein